MVVTNKQLVMMINNAVLTEAIISGWIGMGWYLGGMRCRAAYVANKYLGHCDSTS